MRTTLAILLAWFCITASTVYAQPGSGTGAYGSVGPGGGGGGPTNGLTGAQVGAAILNTNNNDIIPRFAITNNYVRNQNGVVSNTLVISANSIANTNVFQVDALGVLKALEITTNGDAFIGNGVGKIITMRGNIHGIGTITSDGGFLGDGSALTGLEGGNISSGTLPSTAADTSWMPVTNAIAGTNQPMTAGQALVVVGTNTYGATLVKGTNWPSGGGSAFPLSADADFNQHSGTNILSTTYELIDTGLHLRFVLTPDESVVATPVLKLTPAGDLTGNGFAAKFYVASGVLGAGPVDGFIATNAGVSSVLGSNYLNTGTGTFTGGPISFIPTNAAPVLTANGATPSMPWGITNLQAGRVQPVVQYYIVDGASGTPIMTISNQTTGVKLRISEAPLASLTQTNFCILPITTTNTIWEVRDESTGSGASVGVITNWFIGL